MECKFIVRLWVLLTTTEQNGSNINWQESCILFSTVNVGVCGLLKQHNFQFYVVSVVYTLHLLSW